MAITYTAIATTTVGSGGASTIDFQSIPATYTDLILKWSLRDTTGSFWATLALNNSTSSFTGKYIQGEGTGVDKGNMTNSSLFAIVNGSGTTASSFSNGEAYFTNYTSSNNKSISNNAVTENNGAVAYMRMQAFLWSNSAAIDRITLTAGGTFAQYSTATLYGIKNTV